MHGVKNFKDKSYIKALLQYNERLREKGFRVKVEAVNVSVIEQEVNIMVTYTESNCEL